MHSIRTAVAGLLLAGTLTAQIDATAYFPLGPFNIWEMIDAQDFITGETQKMTVKKTEVVDGVVQYNVRTKIFDEVQDVIFRFGVDNGQLFLYGARIVAGNDFNNSDLSIPTIFFTPPVLVGDATTVLDAPPVDTNITSTIQINIDLGILGSFKGPVDIAGTVSSSWQTVGNIATPLEVIQGSELAQLTLTFNFNYSSTDPDIDDELSGNPTLKTVRGIMGQDRGFVQIDGAGSKTMVVNRAIVAGNTIGNFPPLPADISQITVPTPNLFLLNTAAGPEGSVSDGFVTLSNLAIRQQLGGKLFLDAMVDVAGPEGGTAVPVEFKGKIKFKPDGTAKVGFKGKTPHANLLKKLNMKIKADVLPGSTEMLLTYKAGKDVDGLPLAGEIQIPIAPEVVAQAVLDMNYDLVDTKFDPKAKRKLGAEGTLTVGSLTFPVVVLEVLKSKEGFPDKRAYSLVPTGQKSPKFFKFGAESTDPLVDYAILKFKGKLLGIKVKPLDLGTIGFTVD